MVDLSAAPHRPVGGAPVALQVRRAGRTLTTALGRTDSRGTFTLAAPPAGAGYTVATTYQGVPYSVAVVAGQAGRPIQIPVYDTTSSDADLAAMRVVIGLRRIGHGLAVFEQWYFVNAGARTDVGAGGASGRGATRFPLPPGAVHVAIRAAGPPPATADVQQSNVVVNTIVRPATGLNAASFHHVTFTFDLPARAGHPTLLVPTRYFVGRLTVFTVGSRLFAPGFHETTVALGGQKVPVLETQAVPPGSTLAVGVDGPPTVASEVRPAPTAPAPVPFPTTRMLLLFEAGFGGLLVFGLRGRALAPGGSRAHLALQRERARLIGAIAELDLQHARGRVAEADYRRRRAREKGRLLSVARQLGE